MPGRSFDENLSIFYEGPLIRNCIHWTHFWTFKIISYRQKKKWLHCLQGIDHYIFKEFVDIDLDIADPMLSLVLIWK